METDLFNIFIKKRIGNAYRNSNRYWSKRILDYETEIFNLKNQILDLKKFIENSKNLSTISSDEFSPVINFQNYQPIPQNFPNKNIPEIQNFHNEKSNEEIKNSGDIFINKEIIIGQQIENVESKNYSDSVPVEQISTDPPPKKQKLDVNPNIVLNSPDLTEFADSVDNDPTLEGPIEGSKPTIDENFLIEENQIIIQNNLIQNNQLDLNLNLIDQIELNSNIESSTPDPNKNYFLEFKNDKKIGIKNWDYNPLTGSSPGSIIMSKEEKNFLLSGFKNNNSNINLENNSNIQKKAMTKASTKKKMRGRKPRTKN